MRRGACHAADAEERLGSIDPALPGPLARGVSAACRADGYRSLLDAARPQGLW